MFFSVFEDRLDGVGRGDGSWLGDLEDLEGDEDLEKYFVRLFICHTVVEVVVVGGNSEWELRFFLVE